MADIFRKKSLDKLSSPEQLDKMIVINSPLSWLAIAGGGFIILAVLIWAIFGRVPISKEGNGILLGNGEVNSVYAGTQGVITKTYVSGGDEVKAGDVLFEVANQETAYAMNQLEERIEKVEKVTFTSENDEATTDNQQLISLKNQRLTMDLETEGYEEQLKALKKEYSQAKKDLKEAEEALDKAKEAYYGGIASDNSSTIEYEYNKALTEYQTAESLAKSAQASYKSAKNTADAYYVQWSSANDTLKDLQYQISVGSIEVAAQQQSYQTIQTQAQTLAQSASQLAASAQEAANRAAEAEAQALEAENYAAIAPEEEKASALLQAQTARAAATAARQQAEAEAANAQSAQAQASEAASRLESTAAVYNEAATQLSTANTQLKELESSTAKAYQQYCLAANQVSQLGSEYSKAASDRDSKKSTYEAKKDAYEEYIHNIGPSSSQKTKEGNEYNLALTEYNTLKSKKESLAQEIKTVKLQISVGDSSGETQLTSLETQFDLSKQSVLDGLQTELDSYSMLSEGSQIKADVDGIVYSTLVANGSSVGVNSEVARISDKDGDDGLQAVYFMDLDNGKNVKVGMSVNIYANTLAKEEYGHMTGTVVSVANYVTSYADLYSRLGDETLAQTFSKNGSVVEVVCEINEDPDTVSGFEWSSKKGKTAELTEGTLLTGSVVTENVAPITMLIPKLKEMFHME